MRRLSSLPLILLLPVACAQPDRAGTAQVLQEVLAAHEASIAGVGGRAALPVATEARPLALATGAAGAPPSAPASAPASPDPAAAIGAAVIGSVGLGAGGTGAPPGVAGELIGLSPESLRQRLGEPRLRREEGSAEIWHYQASQCHLDVVLYRDEGPRPAWRVAFAAARASGTARRAEAACLRDIARGAARPSPPGLTEQAAAGA